MKEGSADSSTATRNAEAEWLRKQMKKNGMTNSDLVAELEAFGFSGQPNNVSLWATARTTIPNEWLLRLIQILHRPDLSAGEADDVVIGMFARRMPYLAPYFRQSDSEVLEKDRLASRADKSPPSNIYYLPSTGKWKGKRMVLRKNKFGKFEGGISRFGKDKEEFDSLEDVWSRLMSDSSFKVRVSPAEDPSYPGSLVGRDSLIFEWSKSEGFKGKPDGKKGV